MFTSLFEATNALDFEKLIYVILTTLICGFLNSYTYILTHKNKNDNSGFAITLFMLPIVVSVIIILVASDFARAFSIAGVFALIRFRSEPGESKDITYILLASGLGLSTGLGYVWLALVIASICCLLLFILEKLNYGKNKITRKRLRITIPEDLNYEHLFAELLNQYCSFNQYEKVRTIDFGSLFELSYIICLKDSNQEKKFIDELRVLNGNLSISLVMIP